MTTSERILTNYYQVNRSAICLFIARRIPHVYMAEDMAQDVFVRLWNIRQTICEATIKSLVYTVANNIVTDYLRRYIRKCNFDNYLMYYGDKAFNTTEAKIIADNLAEVELRIVTAMPPRRGKVYMLSRYENMSIGDIAIELGMSRRTVETHLFIGRKTMRTEMRKCV